MAPINRIGIYRTLGGQKTDLPECTEELEQQRSPNPRGEIVVAADSSTPNTATTCVRSVKDKNPRAMMVFGGYATPSPSHDLPRETSHDRLRSELRYFRMATVAALIQWTTGKSPMEQARAIVILEHFRPDVAFQVEAAVDCSRAFVLLDALMVSFTTTYQGPRDAPSTALARYAVLRLMATEDRINWGGTHFGGALRVVGTAATATTFYFMVAIDLRIGIVTSETMPQDALSEAPIITGGIRCHGDVECALQGWLSMHRTPYLAQGPEVGRMIAEILMNAGITQNDR
ncbi:MAG: hypothetical protein HYV02_08575 [Deltaproteobacteria bacterium]|nr:hypothetical protein [Deltaproteobacteria bacterium]